MLTSSLITANVGTIFEEANLFELWFKQLKIYLVHVKPQFVAIHCQEVGGKNFATSMKHLSTFSEAITRDEQLKSNYDRIKIFLDEDYESLDRFTALGSIYLVHHSAHQVKLYNFAKETFDTLEDVSVESYKPENPPVNHAQKIKFPQELFPDCWWSRKGFMRTRWLFNERQVVDMVNIHLFHDASNLVAMRTTPSPYAQNRRRALEFTLEKLNQPLKMEEGVVDELKKHTVNQDASQVPLFIFGDFNFRLDTRRVIERISRGASPKVKRCASSNEVLQFVYHLDGNEQNQSHYDTTNITTAEDIDQVNTITEESTKSTTAINLTEINQVDPSSSYGEPSSAPVVMTIGKKLFDFEAVDDLFRENCGWLHEMDNELESFSSTLFEFKISFRPSYPFKEDTSGAYSYMKTRCPAWCDRILFNGPASQVIHSRRDCNIEICDANVATNTGSANVIERVDLLQNDGDVQYGLLGNSQPMGDHKPVLLYCQLST